MVIFYSSLNINQPSIAFDYDKHLTIINIKYLEIINLFVP